MTNKEAIEMLMRLQEPEAWEPQITASAFDALQMGIEALNVPYNPVLQMLKGGRHGD